MEKQPIPMDFITDNELDNITGGIKNTSYAESYEKDICATCGETFDGYYTSVKKQEKEHFIKTGHSVFQPIE